MQASTYLMLADAILVIHLVFILFVILGLLIVPVGGVLGWTWVRNSWFRGLHLLAIAIVVGQAWLGIICPLTTLEMWLRREAGSAAYEGSFIQHWVSQLIYYTAPEWVFIAAYSLFGLLVLVAMFIYPPNYLRKGS